MNGNVESKAALLARLRRAEGQVRGLARMVEEDANCIDVLTQISATKSALDSVAVALLDDHLKHCVSEAAEHGGRVAADKLTDASAAIARLVRS